MDIEFAQEEDLESIVNIYNQAILKTVATFDVQAQTKEDKIEWFDKRSNKHPIFVMKNNNEVAGWVSLSPLYQKEAYNQSVEISIYIDENQRNKGLGSELLKHMMEYINSNQICHTVVAKIASVNDQSIKLHEKYGFEKVGTLKEVGYKFGNYVDVYYYQYLV